MAINLTKMSANGQVVIPAEIRKKMKPKTQFLIVERGNDLLLKRVTEEEIIKEFDAMDTIDSAEDEFKAGRYTELDSETPFEEFDKAMES
jgi:AbrB family looped-hinge helix DNA binding protein